MQVREFDDVFYERFSSNCRERLEVIRAHFAAHGQGKLDPAAAAERICGEIHNVAGEAGLLGLVALTHLGRAVNRVLRHHAQQQGSSFALQQQVCEQYFAVSQRMALSTDEKVHKQGLDELVALVGPHLHA